MPYAPYGYASQTQKDAEDTQIMRKGDRPPASEMARQIESRIKPGMVTMIEVEDDENGDERIMSVIALSDPE